MAGAGPRSLAFQARGSCERPSTLCAKDRCPSSSAAKVLGEKKEPMSTAEMIEAMAAEGYWKSPGGKTPVPRPAFLAAGALDLPTYRELGKGKESRFRKASPGHFTLSGNA